MLEKKKKKQGWGCLHVSCSSASRDFQCKHFLAAFCLFFLGRYVTSIHMHGMNQWTGMNWWQGRQKQPFTQKTFAHLKNINISFLSLSSSFWFREIVTQQSSIGNLAKFCSTAAHPPSFRLSYHKSEHIKFQYQFLSLFGADRENDSDLHGRAIVYPTPFTRYRQRKKSSAFIRLQNSYESWAATLKSHLDEGSTKAALYSCTGLKNHEARWV